MRSLISYLRHTIRRLVKSPGFTITAILILGLGIGGNATIYSVIEAVLLKPLPYPHSEQLVQVYQAFRSFDRLPLDYPDYVDMKAGQHSFRDMAISLNDDFTLTRHGNPELISGTYISGGFSQLFGRPMLIGRPIEVTDAGLMARSFQVLQRTPLGFEAVNRLTADLYLTDANYSDETEYRHFFDTLLERAKTLPGVISPPWT